MTRALLASMLLALTLGHAGAQTVRGEIAFSARTHLIQEADPLLSWAVRGRLEAGYQVDGLEFRLTSEPTLRFGEQPQVQDKVRFELGLQDAFMRHRDGDIDVSVGLERLALETARLSVPYSVEPVNPERVRQGVPGLRVRWFTGMTRVRGGVFVRDEQPGAAFSVRREFGPAEFEGHLTLSQGRVGAGLSGSGLLADLVLYGEAWLLTNPLDTRGALGLSGSEGSLMWTIEGAYLADTPTQEARPIILAQLDAQHGERGEWRLAGRSAFDPDGVRGQLSASYTRLERERDITLRASGQFGPEPLHLGLELDIRGFF